MLTLLREMDNLQRRKIDVLNRGVDVEMQASRAPAPQHGKMQDFNKTLE